MARRDMRRRSVPADDLRLGIGLAATTALISGVAVFLNANGVKQVPDPAVYTTLKNGVAAILLITLVAATPAARGAIPAGCASMRRWSGENRASSPTGTGCSPATGACSPTDARGSTARPVPCV